MTEYSGYLFTTDPQLALDMCGHGGVRYAAQLDDGRGFAAFDTDREGLYKLGTLGQVFTQVEADPNDPDTWPVWTRPHAPHKKFESTMSDRFVLYATPTRGQSASDYFRDLVQAYSPKAAAVVWDADEGEFSILVEGGPDWTAWPVDPIWDCGITEFRDVRVGPFLNPKVSA